MTCARQITLTWSPPAGSQWGGAMPDGLWNVAEAGSGVIKCSDLLTGSPPDVVPFDLTFSIDSSM